MGVIELFTLGDCKRLQRGETNAGIDGAEQAKLSKPVGEADGLRGPVDKASRDGPGRHIEN